MCDIGIGIGMGLLSLGTGIFSAIQQQDAINQANSLAEQQATFQSINDTLAASQQSYWAMEQAQKAEDNAMKAAERDYELLQAQEGEVNAQAATKAFERLRQGMRERSKLMVAAAEAGAMGQSEQVGEANVLFNTAYDQALIEQERRTRIAYTEAQKDATSQTLKDRLDAADQTRLQGKIGMDAASVRGLQTLANVKRYNNLNPFVESLRIGSGALSAGFSGYATAKSAGIGKSMPSSGSSSSRVYGSDRVRANY